MATNIKIFHAHDFIKATPEGQLDLERSKNVLVDIAKAATALEDYEIILDIRLTQIGMTITDLYTLAAELNRHRRIFSRKVAVLCALDRYDRAEFFALAAQNKGFNIQAFTSYEATIEWLNRDED